MAHPRSTQDPAGAFGGLGRAKTTLPDGRVVLIGGERELPPETAPKKPEKG
jgi:hypothetical protein